MPHKVKQKKQQTQTGAVCRRDDFVSHFTGSVESQLQISRGSHHGVNCGMNWGFVLWEAEEEEEKEEEKEEEVLGCSSSAQHGEHCPDQELV